MPVDQAAAALSVAQGYCRWHVYPSQDDVLTLDGSGTYLQLLPSLLVTAVTSVVEDGVVLTEDTDYEWSADGTLKRLGFQPWTRKLRGLVVTLTHGYDTEPADFAAVVERLASRAASDAGAVRQVGQVAYATTSVGVGLAGTLSDYDKAELAPYRIVLLR